MASEIDIEETTYLTMVAVKHPGTLYMTAMAFVGPTWIPEEDRLQSIEEIKGSFDSNNRRIALLVTYATVAFVSGAFQWQLYTCRCLFHVNMALLSPV